MHRSEPPLPEDDEDAQLAEQLHYLRIEREWQDDVGYALLEKPYEVPGAAAVFDRQADRLIARLDLREPSTIVEIGCGKGHFLERLRSATHDGWRLVGLDISRAVHALPGKGLLGVQGDGGELPFAAGVASHVLFDGSLHHVIDYRGALREAIRILRPGGYLVLFEPVNSRFTRFIHRLLDPIIFRKSVVYESPIDIRYKDAFLYEEIIAELRHNGMEARTSRSDFLAYPLTGCYAGSFVSRRQWLMRSAMAMEDAVWRLPGLRWLAAQLAWRFTVVATKPGDGLYSRSEASDGVDRAR